VEFLLVLVVLAGAVLVIAGPLRSGARPEEGEDADRAALEAAKEAKYREIRDAELDYRTGKLSDSDYRAVDRQLRAEAVEILRKDPDLLELVIDFLMTNVPFARAMLGGKETAIDITGGWDAVDLRGRAAASRHGRLLQPDPRAVPLERERRTGRGHRQVPRARPEACEPHPAGAADRTAEQGADRARAPVSTALEPVGGRLVAALAADLPRERLIRTSLVDCGIGSAAEAQRAFDAFCQWFAAVPLIPEGSHHVMLKGSVDRMWHAVILNTNMYRTLCETYLGFFLDHHPRDDYPPQPWIQETVYTLVLAHGSGLSPLLSAWSPSTVARLAATPARAGRVDGRRA